MAIVPSDQPYPDDNPKTVMGAKKLPLWVVPFSAICALAEALVDGARKYGPYNWRKQRITASTYLSAIYRHLGAYHDGEDYAKDSGVHHLKHAMACLALMIDADSLGMLNDDRPSPGAGPRLLEEWQALEEVKRMRAEREARANAQGAVAAEAVQCPALFINENCQRRCVLPRGHSGLCEWEVPPSLAS